MGYVIKLCYLVPKNVVHCAVYRYEYVLDIVRQLIWRIILCDYLPDTTFRFYSIDFQLNADFPSKFYVFYRKIT